MGKKKKARKGLFAALPPTVAGVVVITANLDGQGFGTEIESDLSPTMLAAILRTAADHLEGKTDRAAETGAWGR